LQEEAAPAQRQAPRITEPRGRGLQEEEATPAKKQAPRITEPRGRGLQEEAAHDQHEDESLQYSKTKARVVGGARPSLTQRARNRVRGDGGAVDTSGPARGREPSVQQGEGGDSRRSPAQLGREPSVLRDEGGGSWRGSAQRGAAGPRWLQELPAREGVIADLGVRPHQTSEGDRALRCPAERRLRSGMPVSVGIKRGNDIRVRGDGQRSRGSKRAKKPTGEEGPNKLGEPAENPLTQKPRMVWTRICERNWLVRLCIAQKTRIVWARICYKIWLVRLCCF
jgi:hypothetical protein